jgi:hypothetical protein
MSFISEKAVNAVDPNKSKRFKQTLPGCQRVNVFWERNGVLMVEFMQQGTTIV